MIEVITVYGLEKVDDIQLVEEEYLNESPLRSNDREMGTTCEAAYQAIVYENKRPVAIGRLICKPNYEIDKVYVLKNYRNNYYGDVIIKVLLDKGFSLGAIEVIAYVPKELIEFFEKIGFYDDHYKLQEKPERIRMCIKKENIIKCKK